ncbi:MAG: excinuclease ABC subunit UvrC [Bacteroidales bacterium]
MSDNFGTIKNKTSFLPNKPGVYQFFNKAGKIIYIGKAIDIKKRVSSYFRDDNKLSAKTKLLVSKIADIKYIVVDTEYDALLLENNLIKKYKPRYNIQLKDDKTYPWIVIKNEPFPRVLSTRHHINDGSSYFGPYASVRMMNTLLELIRKLYKLRSCKLNLSERAIKNKNYKVCLEYHINNCEGACIGKQSEEDYMNSINEIKNILKGNFVEVKNNLYKLMAQYSEQYEFEKAQEVKEKIDILARYQSKSLIVSDKLNNFDVFSFTEDVNSAYVNFIKVMYGAIVQSHTIELRKRLDESKEFLLEMAITDIRQRFSSETKHIIVPFLPETKLPNATYIVPQAGNNKKLLELSERNAIMYKLERHKQTERVDPNKHTARILKQLQQDLRLPNLPVRIECFDNSNIQGTYPVAAMSVFINGKPAKDQYRHFHIKTVKGANDFASMQEVIYRRYKRLLDEKSDLPQLIIVDGGKGQLSSAMASLEKLDLHKKIPIISIAEKLEEIYYPNDSLPMYIDKKSETLKIIQHLRDEAHRFGVSFHRNLREKGTIKTELTQIKGIGETSAKNLLKHFGSVEGVKNATQEQLAEVVGAHRAELVFSYFKDSR